MSPRVPVPVVERPVRALAGSHRPVLRPWQVDMLAYMHRVQHAALFVDPRLGKTLPTCIRIRQMYPAADFNLIVGPYSCLYGWEETLRSLGETDILYLIGDRLTRFGLLTRRRRWCLLNKEGWDYLREIAQVDWDAVVLDESTFIKNYRVKVSKFYVRHFRFARWRAILSGTPAPESELEYFQQLKFLDPEIIPEERFYVWRERHFVQSAQSHRWYIRTAYRETLGRKLSRYCYFMKRSDVRVREKEYAVRKVRMPQWLRERYQTVEEEFVLELPELGEEKRTIWPMERFIWLRNLCSGIVDGKVLWEGKVQSLIEFLETELHGQQVVIWCAYIQELDEVQRRLPDRSAIICGKVSPDAREAYRQSFMRGHLQYIIAQPETFRHGTDLSAADTMSYFSTPLGLETRQQTEDRIISMELERIAYYVDHVVEDSVEESILQGLKRKERANQLMLRIVRDARRRVDAAHS